MIGSLWSFHQFSLSIQVYEHFGSFRGRSNGKHSPSYSRLTPTHSMLSGDGFLKSFVPSPLAQKMIEKGIGTEWTI